MGETFKFTTTRFGDMEAHADKVITFPNGMPGFEAVKRFVLIDHDEQGMFKWLQAVDFPQVAFLLTDPTGLKPDFALPRETNLEPMGFKRGDTPVVMVMVYVTRGDRPSVHLNLKGPVVFNYAAMSGVQLIIDREDYPCDWTVKPACPA